MSSLAYHVRAAFLLLVLAFVLLLSACSSYGPSMEVKETVTKTFDESGKVVSETVTTEVDGKQSGVAMLDSNDTQKEVSDNWRAVELEKMKIFKSQTCKYPDPPAEGFKGSEAEQEYYRMVDNVLEGCQLRSTLMAVAFQTDQLGDNIQEASGVGSMNSQVSKSSASIGIAAEQSSASKHASWGKVTVGSIGIWGLSNASSSWAQAAGQGGATVFAANGSRVNYSNAGNADQYKDGFELTAIGDKATTSPTTGDSPIPGASTTTNSASGDHTGDITTNNSPIFFMNERLNFTNLEPDSTAVFDNGVLTSQEGSNDNNAFGGGITGTTDNNTSSPNR